MIDNKPLAYGYVRFIPEKGRLSVGQLDAQGRFSLAAYEPNDGALRGTHRVEVEAGEPLSETKTRWHAPKHYALAASSELTATIDGPTDDLLIELTWSGKSPYVETHP